MLRFICRHVNTGDAAHVGAPIDIRCRTFTDVTALERWLRYDGEESYAKDHDTREVLGVELVEET